MVSLLRIYLLQNRSISIPGLGTIYVERSPARSDFINRQLLSPTYHFRFDKYFDAPGRDFFTFLAARKNIEDYEAIRQFNEWAQQLRTSIGNESPTLLEGLGTLQRDSSGDIVFVPPAAANTLEISVPAERIIRTNAKHTMLVGDKEITNVEMTDYLQVTQKKKAAWWIYALIAAAIALAAILFHYYRSGNQPPSGNGQTIETR